MKKVASNLITSTTFGGKSRLICYKIARSLLLMKANSIASSAASRNGATPKKKPSSTTASPARASPSVIIADKFPGLSLQSKVKRPIRTGLMYDPAMLAYTSIRDDNYLDSPARASTCYNKCRTSGLVSRCIRLKINPCTDEDLLTVHDADFIEKMKSSSNFTEEELIDMERKYHDVCFHQKSVECARLSAGATIGMVKAIVSDEVTNGMAIIRPPGHHASKDEACGLCYFNNVAIAAKHCLDDLGLDKVLIVDWDVHHGQGTQRTFYNDPRVLYISIHRYEHGWFWPNLRESDYDYIGEGAGKGFNVNIPLNKTGMTDGDYLTIFHQLIMPLAMEFNPSAVIVSAGYDCALGCPEGEMEVTPPLFGHLIHKLRCLADGRLAVILEGGYHLESLSEGVAYSVRGLLDDNCALMSSSQPPQPELVNVILNCIDLLRLHWKCFQYQAKDYAEKAVKLGSTDARGQAALDVPDYGLYDTPPQPEDVKNEFTEKIRDIVKRHPARTTKHRTSYVYDDHMMKHKCALDPSHPERPERISRIRDMLDEYGLLQKCIKLPSRKATRVELGSVHTGKHIEAMKSLETTKPREFRDIESGYSSIYLHPESYSCALMAAGSLLNVVDSVMKDESRNGFAIIRPPGHHAEADVPCGFCFFNNVPVAAKYAQEKHSAKKILIVDWDVHHGNGTQHMFETDDSVLYISLHRYDNSSFYPGSPAANFDHVGKGKGKGFNVNIPFNRKFDENYIPSRPMGDSEYIAAFQQIVMPISYEFAPDLILISAGFDAAKGDPLGGYRITPGGYAHMTHMLSSLASGRVILALEGGYNLNSISECFSSCVDVLLGGLPPRIKDTEPDSSAVETIRNVLRVHKKYWKSLCCDVVLPYNKEEMEELRAKEGEEDAINKLAERFKEAKVSEKSSSKPSSKRGASTSTPNPQRGTRSKPTKPAATVGSVATPDSTSNSAAGNEPTQSAAPAPSPSAGSAGDCNVEEMGAAAADGPSSASWLGDNSEMFAVTPLSWCAHLEDNTPLTEELDTALPCSDCGHVGENWVCLTCYKVYCSRYVNEHMLFHSLNTEHKMVLSYADLSVWCYGCDSYVHNIEILPMKNSAHRHKFGSSLEGF